MSRPSSEVAMIAMLAAFVLLASNVAANLASLPALGVKLTAPVSVVNLGGQGSGLFPAASSQPSGPVPQTEILSTLIILGLLVGFMVWRVRKLALQDRGARFRSLSIIVALGIFVAIMLAGRAVIDMLISAGTRPSGTEVDYLDPSLILYSTAALAVAVLAASALLGVLGLSRRGRTTATTSAAGAGETVMTEFTTVIDNAVYSLQEGSDFRVAVLACYRDLCAVLRDGGADDSPVLTAREFEDAATERLEIKTGYLRRMTRLFEKARYSSNEISRDDVTAAEDSLLELQRELHSRGDNHRHERTARSTEEDYESGARPLR